MALKAVLDTLDGVEEGLQQYYKHDENDGKYYLDLEGVEQHPSTQGLQTSRDRLLAEKKTASEKLRAAEARLEVIPEDFDAERWEQLKAEAEAREQDPDNKDVHKQIESATSAVRQQYEQKLEQARQKWEQEKAEIAAERDKEREFSRKNLVQSVITKALTEANIKPALMDAAQLLLERRIEIIEEEGEDGEQERRVMMKPEYGGEEPTKFIQSWVQTDAGREFVLPATGGGSQGNNRHRSNEVNPWAKETWNLTEQGRVLREDRAKAERMARAAGRSLPA